MKDLDVVRVVGLSVTVLAAFVAVSSAAVAQSSMPAGAAALVAAREGPPTFLSLQVVRHSVAHLAAVVGLRHAPPLASHRFSRLAKVALSQLLEAADLEGEAAERGIALTTSQLDRHFRAAIRRRFRSTSQYRNYLKRLKLTVADLRRGLKLRLLGTRIIAAVRRMSPGGKQAEIEALEDFRQEYAAKWRTRTTCVTRFANPRCGDVVD